MHDNRQIEPIRPDSGDRKPTPIKKPYKPPALQMWGTLRDMTQATGWSGGADGAKRYLTRTR
ncbi:MAG: hypothetical protein ACKOEC_09765 [Acidimicrobiia bacterium]